MISNVNSISSAVVNNISSPPDEAPAAEDYKVITSVSENADKLEISNEAHTASINSQVVIVKPPTRDFMELFSVKIWSLGLEEQK